MRSLIVGPPAVGKTTVAKALCEHYKLHHIKMKDVIDETIANLVSSGMLDLRTWLFIYEKNPYT